MFTKKNITIMFIVTTGRVFTASYIITTVLWLFGTKIQIMWILSKIKTGLLKYGNVREVQQGRKLSHNFDAVSIRIENNAFVISATGNSGFAYYFKPIFSEQFCYFLYPADRSNLDGKMNQS